MGQIKIYDLFTDIKDPVYELIAGLKKGESVAIEDMQLSLNHYGLYELSGETWHESFRGLEKCYRFICDQESTQSAK